MPAPAAAAVIAVATSVSVDTARQRRFCGIRAPRDKRRSKPLLTYRHQLLASPDYLACTKTPKHPKDLHVHRLLTFGHAASGQRWAFRRGDETTTITIQPVLAMNDYAGLAGALAAGAGIGELPPIVRPDFVASGKLVEVMPGWRLRTETLSMVHLSARHIARPLRAFIDFAAQQVPVLLPNLPK